MSTFDKFLNQLTRFFAKDLGLSPSQKLETDTEWLLEKSVQKLLKSLDNEQIKSYLAEYLTLKIEDDKGWNIEKGLVVLANQINNDAHYNKILQLINSKYNDELFTNLSDVLKQIVTDFETVIKEKATEIQEIILKSGNENMFYRGYFPKYIDKLTKKRIQKPTENFLQQYREGTWGSRANNTDSFVYYCNSKIKPKFDEILQLFDNDQVEYNTSKIALENIYQMALISFTYEAIEETKKEENLIFVNDINKLIFKVIMEESPAYLFWRMGSKYRHLMLDEFQDTNEIQYENIKFLMEESYNNENGSLLVVGDEKQAIYSFRGSKDSILNAKLKKDFPDHKNEMLLLAPLVFYSLLALKNQELLHHTQP